MKCFLAALLLLTLSAQVWGQNYEKTPGPGKTVEKKPGSGKADRESAASTKYGLMVSAFGVLAGSFFQVLAINVSCRQNHPDLGASFRVGFKEYQYRNKFLDNTKTNLYNRAKKEGGSAEVSRLQIEISKAINASRDRVENFANSLSSEQCRTYLSKIVNGELDLKKKVPNEVELLMGK